MKNESNEEFNSQSGIKTVVKKNEFAARLFVKGTFTDEVVYSDFPLRYAV